MQAAALNWTAYDDSARPAVAAVFYTKQGGGSGNGGSRDNGQNSNQGGNMVPEDENGAESRPEQGISFRKGENDMTGWDVIRAEEEQAEEGRQRHQCGYERTNGCFRGYF